MTAEPESEGRPASWGEWATWRGDGLRREVFFFDADGVRLYGSLFAAEEIRRPAGVVCCNSWGIEADRCDHLQRSVALAMAKLGGVGMVFHYPGYGDSFGDLGSLGLDDLSAATVGAVREAARRYPGIDWTLAGFMLGASVACVARRSTNIARLLFVQPSLRPGSYFRWLEEHGSRNPLRFAVIEGLVHGYPLPGPLLENAATADAEAEAALAGFSGPVTTIQYAKSAEPISGLPVERGEAVEVPGRWRFGLKRYPELAAAATEWPGWIDG